LKQNTISKRIHKSDYQHEIICRLIIPCIYSTFRQGEGQGLLQTNQTYFLHYWATEEILTQHKNSCFQHKIQMNSYTISSIEKTVRFHRWLQRKPSLIQTEQTKISLQHFQLPTTALQVHVCVLPTALFRICSIYNRSYLLNTNCTKWMDNS